MEKPVELSRISPTQSLATKTPDGYLVWIHETMTKLAMTLGASFEPSGVAQAQLTTDLSGLPRAALEYAVIAWRKGDKRLMSQAWIDNTPGFGKFMPKAVELRDLALAWLREQSAQNEAERATREIREWERDRDLHPENYVSTAEMDERIARLNAKHRMGKIVPIVDTKTTVDLPLGELMRLTAADAYALWQALARRELRAKAAEETHRGEDECREK